MIWYGGGKLAPDLTLPKLRTRWASPAGYGPADGAGLSGRGGARCAAEHGDPGRGARAG